MAGLNATAWLPMAVRDRARAASACRRPFPRRAAETIRAG